MITGARARARRDVGEEQMHLLRARRRRTAAAAAATHADRVGEAARRIDLQRLVVERQRTLVAGAAGGEIAAGEEPARPGRQELLNLVAAGARLRERGLDVGGRRRQLRPAIHGLAGRIRGVRLVHHGPDVIGEPAGDAFLRREPANRRGGIAERDAMLVIPRDVEAPCRSVRGRTAGPLRPRPRGSPCAA